METTLGYSFFVVSCGLESVFEEEERYQRQRAEFVSKYFDGKRKQWKKSTPEKVKPWLQRNRTKREQSVRFFSEHFVSVLTFADQNGIETKPLIRLLRMIEDRAELKDVDEQEVLDCFERCQLRFQSLADPLPKVQVKAVSTSLVVDVDKLTATIKSKTVIQLQSEQVARWLKVLSDNPGKYISSAGLNDYDPELLGARAARYYSKLPAKIRDMIEPKRGSGFRLRVA